MAQNERIRDEKTGEYKPSNSPRLVALSTKVYEFERVLVRVNAERLGVSVSEFIRDAVLYYLTHGIKK
jgi:hypothetical protein